MFRCISRSRSRSRSRSHITEHDSDVEADGPGVLYTLIFMYVSTRLYPKPAQACRELERRARTVLMMFDVPIRCIIGVSSNPLKRFRSYVAQGCHRMFIIWQSMSCTDTEFYETHLIRVMPITCTLTRTNKAIRYGNKQLGADGSMDRFPGPYFIPGVTLRWARRRQVHARFPIVLKS